MFRDKLLCGYFPMALLLLRIPQSVFLQLSLGQTGHVALVQTRARCLSMFDEKRYKKKRSRSNGRASLFSCFTCLVPLWNKWQRQIFIPVDKSTYILDYMEIIYCK